MHEKLVSFVDTLKADGRITSFDEAATKQAVIAKLLTLLGWDFFDIDEVKPEFAVGSKRVDFSLRHNHSNKVFIRLYRKYSKLC
jgi:predicted type IV restriction endonuclease